MQFTVWANNGDRQPKTMPRIAKALNMTPQQRIHELLQEMVEAGDLTVEERDQSGRWTTKFYLLVESRIITEKYSRRHISVKRKGVPVGQLEMWQ
jgi:predicted ArsR family transcriptional regulator